MLKSILLSGFLLMKFWAPSWAQMQLLYHEPAHYFEESLPIGNGKLGGLVYGNPKHDTIYLNDITLWTGKPVDLYGYQKYEKHSLQKTIVRPILYNCICKEKIQRFISL